MWSYDKRLIHPVKVKKPDPKSASIIITQLGGPHGELERQPAIYSRGTQCLTAS